MGKLSYFIRISAFTSAIVVAFFAIGLSFIQSTTWWAGYDVNNCNGCKSIIDWTSHKSKQIITSKHIKSYQKNGVILLQNAIDSSKVTNLAKEVESMNDTFMTTILTKIVLRQYSKYEHKLDTRSEVIRDWAVHGPLGKWAAQLMNVKEVRLYNAEKIYSAGDDNPNGCATAWHRDTVAAPFPISTKSITINIYLDDIQADAPNGDVLIYALGSHKDLHSPPHIEDGTLFEPLINVGDILAHDPHIYHTPSGRGCWNRRSLQFRYVESPTTFHFGANRFPHGPIPWTFAHAPGIAPHGLNEGDKLEGPWYPRVFPEPLESEHVPINRSSWSILGVLGIAKEAQDFASELGIGTDNCTIIDSKGRESYSYFGFDGPVSSCDDWTLIGGLPLHKNGQMIKTMSKMMSNKN